VIKVIKDEFGHSKHSDRATVKRKFLMVKEIDRVGRMADTLEFKNLALPRARFAPELLEQLLTLASQTVSLEGENVIVGHCYVERRMTPLNLYLETAPQEEIENVVREYGDAIAQLARANIFAGDLLFKNFGVTRFGRVVFYDYDEIEYLTDCRFRRIPPPPPGHDEMSGDVWYAVGPRDVFPEEFATFLLTDPEIREAFMRYHANLLDAQWWQQVQHSIASGEVPEVLSYPESARFRERHAAAVPAAS
jgi:isocitrate dehydrogenase kinase/phosphatase